MIYCSTLIQFVLSFIYDWNFPNSKDVLIIYWNCYFDKIDHRRKLMLLCSLNLRTCWLSEFEKVVGSTYVLREAYLGKFKLCFHVYVLRRTRFKCVWSTGSVYSTCILTTMCEYIIVNPLYLVGKLEQVCSTVFKLP